MVQSGVDTHPESTNAVDRLEVVDGGLLGYLLLLNASIDRLKLEQHRLLPARSKSSLRNAERKRKRLRERARQLTDEDLLSATLMRKEKKKGIHGAGGPEGAQSNTDAGAPVHSPSA